jgi:WD40 repeat protein
VGLDSSGEGNGPDGLAGAASEDGTGGSPLPTPEAHSCSDAAETLTATLVWEYEIGSVGVGPGNGFFGFSPDGSTLLMQGGSYSPTLLSVSTSDFAVRNEAIDHHIVARDRGWHTELRSQAQLYYYWVYDFAVVDLDAGATLLDAWPATEIEMTLLAGSGETGVQVDYAESQLELTTFAVGSGSSTSVLTDVPIGSDAWAAVSRDAGGVPRTITQNGDAVLIADHATGDFFRIETATGRWTRVEAHAAYNASGWPEVSYSGAIASLTLSPSERVLASVGADHQLRLWSYPELRSLSFDAPSTWMNAFTNCYTNPVTYAPVAWSPDEELIAASDTEGNVAVRRACDGKLLATLPRSLASLCTPPDLDHFGPSFIAFSPRGDLLAVLFDAGLQIYRIE